MYEITLDFPGKNALSAKSMQFLLDELATANGRPLLLSGAGGAFSAGLNLKEVAQLDIPGMETFLGLLDRLMAALFTYPGPTVAAVNGHAIAGGAILALCCDLRVGANDPKLKIGLNEVALGLHFPPKILAICRHRLPPQQLERVLLGAGLHGPQEAVALGLLDEVADEVMATAKSRLEALAAHPAHAYSATKRHLREGVVTLHADDELKAMNEAMPSWTSAELKERIAAMFRR